MPDFEIVHLNEAQSRTAFTGRRGQNIQEYIGYIQRLGKNQAGKFQIARDEKIMTIRRRLALAAETLGVNLVEAVGAHYRSVQRWVAWYREEGLTEMRRLKMGGRRPQPFLSAEAEMQLSDALGEGQQLGRYSGGMHLGSEGTLGKSAVRPGNDILPPRQPLVRHDAPSNQFRVLNDVGSMGYYPGYEHLSVRWLYIFLYLPLVPVAGVGGLVAEGASPHAQRQIHDILEGRQLGLFLLEQYHMSYGTCTRNLRL